MAEQAYAYVTLIPVAKGFQAKIASEMSGIGGVGGQAGKQFSQGFGGALKGLIGPALFAGAGLAVANFAKSSIKQASTLQESLNAVNVSFGASAAGIKKLGEQAAASLGVSNAEFNAAAVGFASFAKTIAGPGVDVTSTIDQLTTRASDFASVMDLDVADALQKFRAGLSGEAEPLKQFGVNVSEANVQNYAYANGIAEMGAQLTETQKIQARFGFIMQETSLMAGDFANTSDGWANSMRILGSTVADVQSELGNALLPALQELVPVIKDVVLEFGPKLKSALESVNWRELIDSIVNVIEFLAENAQIIGTVIAALVLLKATYEIGAAAVGIYKAATFLLGNTFTITAGKIGLATGALKLFKTALITTGIGALVVALGFIIEGATELDSTYRQTTPTTTSWGDALLKTGHDAQWAASQYGTATTAVKGYKSALSGLPSPTIDPQVKLDDALYNIRNAPIVPKSIVPEMPVPDLTGGIGKSTKKAIKEAKKAIKEAQKEYRKAVQEANQQFAERSAEISENYSMAIARATINRDKELAQALKDNTKRVADIQADFAKRLDDIVKQSMQRLRDAYRSSVEINVASIFDSDAIAGSIDGTIEMMRQKLIASRQLLANAASLAAAGFSQTFIEQVVGAGTEVGNELAQGILNATPEQQAEMRTLFNSIETEASSGMDALSATIYEKNGLATQALKDLYAQTQGELVTALAEQETLYQEQMTQIMATFDQAVLDAKAARDAALLDAEKSLQEALATANENFLSQIKTIKAAFKDQIDAMTGMVNRMIGRLNALAAAASNAMAAAASASAGTKSGPKIAMATGGLVTGPTNALIGEAGPELVIPLDRFESWMNMDASGKGKSLNYYAAPNQSLDSETELFNAMKRAKVVVGW